MLSERPKFQKYNGIPILADPTLTQSPKKTGQGLSTLPCLAKNQFVLQSILLFARQFFLDPRGLARTFTEVVELGATHVTTALDFDCCDQR
jgi:hypothetical protein